MSNSKDVQRVLKLIRACLQRHGIRDPINAVSLEKVYAALRRCKDSWIDDVTMEDCEIHLTEDTGEELFVWGLSDQGIRFIDRQYPVN